MKSNITISPRVGRYILASIICWLVFFGSCFAQKVKGNKYPVVESEFDYSIIASSRNDNSHPADDCNDDSNDSYWESNRNGNIYLRLDLGEVHPPVQSIQCRFSGGQYTSSTLELSVSDDNNNYTSIGTVGLSGTNTTVSLSTPITQRYVYVLFARNNRYNNLRVSELNLLGDKYSGKRIQHKPAKWHAMRSASTNYIDKFDDDVKMYPWIESDLGYPDPTGGTGVQATHLYIDTLYVYRGTSVNLVIPGISAGQTAVASQSYQRWYNYRTDGLYRTNQAVSDDNVVDLLTPYKGEGVRVGNGYVGQPLSTSTLSGMTFYVPTRGEYDDWFGTDDTYGDDWFVVACDLSLYNDFTAKYTSTSKDSLLEETWYEPTIAQRVIFVIRPIDDQSEKHQWKWMNQLKETEFQGGGNGEKTKYLEEYVISYPSVRLSNKTKELVALKKDARAYAIPGLTVDSGDKGTLQVTLLDGAGGTASGITLETTSLSGDKRVIKFNYPTVSGKSYQEVPDKSTATILVTKTVGEKTYNLVRFKLNFALENSLLTETMLAQLETPESLPTDEYWSGLTYRTRSVLNEKYKLLTSLNWDYDPDVADDYGKSGYYQFPMSWGYSSYGFFDGCPNNEKVNGGQGVPEWGYYSITNEFIGEGSISTQPHVLDGSTYHMYVDASDRPGVLAELSFREKLCKGSEIFVTAWVKSSNWNNSESTDDIAMLFTIYGVIEKDGKQTKVPLVSHATGQVRNTNFLDASLPGCGSANNEWFQTYFSFINEDDNIEYDSYVIAVENNCASTSGGDMYLDNIRVYLGTPSADVAQLQVTCVDELTRMNIGMDWDRLLSRTGEVERTANSTTDPTQWNAIDFCFIDRLKYEDYRKEHPATDPNDPEQEKAAIKAALEHSLMLIESKDDGLTYKNKFGHLFYNLYYNGNKRYSDSNEPLAINNPLTIPGLADKQHGFYRGDDNVTPKNLTVDFYSRLVPNRPYIMVINTSDGSAAPTIDDFTNLEDPCAITTSFWVTSTNLMKMNGEIIDPSQDYCAGNIFDFTATLRVPYIDEETQEEKYLIVEEGVMFDWYFGPLESFIDVEYENTLEDGSKSKFDIYSALKNFRAMYPTATELTTDMRGAKKPADECEDGQAHYLSVEEYDKLYELSTTKTSLNGQQGKHSLLELYRDKLDIQLMADRLDLMISPIQTKLPPNGILTEEEWALVCWGYIPVHLSVSGDAPSLHAGFNTVNYPDAKFNPSLRIGKAQLERLKDPDEDLKLTIRLRDAEFVSDDPDAVMGKVNNMEGYDLLYLIDTDDPDLKPYLNEVDYTTHSLPIGEVVSLEAHRYDTEVARYDDHMEIKFDFEGKLAQAVTPTTAFKFTPREGYFYTFMNYYEEHVGEEGTGNACIGTIPVTMKVVPEYLVWKGEETGNFNNDDNWERVTTAARVQKTSDDFLDGNTNANGYVPMIFSKVIIPEGKKVELYKAGFNNGGNVWTSERPDHMQPPTENIMYDLMTYEHPADDGTTDAGRMTTERFRANIVNMIHFEPDAQMLHAERLIYDRAWVDYKLTPGQWHTLAPQFSGVVAGDFYTGSTSGREEAEYFTPITYQATRNNRFSPAIYQRSWKPSNAVNTELSGTKDMAIAAQWSSVYNDVDEPYYPGGGVSVKVTDLPAGKSDIIVRMPKDDAAYYYYKKGESAPTGDAVSVSEQRIYDPLYTSGESGYSPIDPLKLAIDVLCLRKSDYDSAIDPSRQFVFKLEDTADGKYYLVGNPFMAHMDMAKFFEENQDILEPKYWLVDGNNQDAAVGTGDGTWITANGANGPYVPPLKGFFVEKKSSVTTDMIEFTTAMEAPFAAVAAGTTEAGAAPMRVILTDENGNQSHAAVMVSATAQSGYEANEDAILLADGNLMSTQPLVYTVGGQHALSVNSTNGNEMIPLGVAANGNKRVMLSFENSDACNAQLYDARTGSTTPIDDLLTVSMSVAENGRYFIAPQGTTGIDGKRVLEQVNVWAQGGRIQIASSDNVIREVRVYDLSGSIVTTEAPQSRECSVVMKAGNYITSVVLANGKEYKSKVCVK